MFLRCMNAIHKKNGNANNILKKINVIGSESSLYEILAMIALIEKLMDEITTNRIPIKV